MWNPWQQVTGWGRASNARAVGNARTASTSCSRARVEREAVELFLDAQRARRQPARAVAPGAAPRPA